ncbi:MAG: hypothetical protein OEW00_13735 [candidate division Zixibacteria bacterium]|nr:hypothetical protein [candidate division Zixibacteria bacterium]
MPIEHLTDDDIQRYLDGHTCLENDQIREHLEICPACQDALEMYRQVYAGLVDDRDLLLPDDFARRVTAKLAVSKGVRWPAALTSVAAAGAGLVLSAVVLYFLVGWQPILAYFTNLSLSEPEFLRTFVSAILGQLAYLNGGLTIVVSGALVLFFYGTIDRLLAKAKIKHT